MPLIPYPNVPNLPGVPALSRSNNAQFAAAALTVVGELLPLNLFGTKWAILDKNGNNVLIPDNFVNFEYREEAKIPTYPVENGGFASYNKVRLPFDCRLTVTCSGNGAMKKGQFIQAINNLLHGTDLVSIVTPDAQYQNCNLIHVDYRKEARSGATLLIVQLWFQLVRQITQPINPTAQPSGQPVQNNGQVSPVPPTTNDINASNKGTIDFIGGIKPSERGSWD